MYLTGFSLRLAAGASRAASGRSQQLQRRSLKVERLFSLALEGFYKKLVEGEKGQFA